MKHVLKFSEWQSGSGTWRAADVENLSGRSNAWWLPARMLNLSLTDYILLVKNKYHASNFVYFRDKNLLFWGWKNYNDCHAFVLFINREAKKRKFFVE